VNRQIWSIICEFYAAGSPIDRITVYRRAKDLGYENVTLGYLVDLDNELPQIFHLDTYVERLKDIGIRRQLIHFLDAAQLRVADMANDSKSLLAEMAQLTSSLRDGLETKNPIRNVTRVVEEAGGLDYYFSPEYSKNVIPSPWSSLQDRFIGFQPGKLYLIAARPSVGKTAMALQLAYHAAELGDHPFFASLEMDEDELINRTLSCQAGIPFGKLIKRNLSREDRVAISRVVGGEVLPRIRFDTSALVTIPSLRTKLLSLDPQPQIVITDYLQLMKGSGRTRNEEVASISRGLKLLAKETGVAFVALSQMSRPEKGMRPKDPELEDLRDSGSLEQDADFVGFLNSKSSDDDAPVRDVWMHIKKQRNGPKGRVLFSFNGAQQRFEEQRPSTVLQDRSHEEMYP